MSTTAYCDQCGTPREGGASFCVECGSSLPNDPVPSSVTATATQHPDARRAQPRVHSASSPAAMQGIVTPGRRASCRSKAWIYYAILAVLSIVSVLAGKPIGLLGTLLFGAYSYYLYQGGRVVIWFW
jgi:hypothetical protein